MEAHQRRYAALLILIPNGCNEPVSAEKRRTRSILIQQASSSDTHNPLPVLGTSMGGAIQRNKPPRFRVEKG